MTVRYWLSGPRLLNGLVRHGISFNARDAAALFRSRTKVAPVSLLVVAASNGAVTLVRDQTEGASALDALPGVDMPVVFAFRSVTAAEAVLTGARKRLAQKPQLSGWYTNISAGQLAAAVKAEATAFSYDFDIVHPVVAKAGPAKTAKKGRLKSRMVTADALLFYLVVALFGMGLASMYLTANSDPKHHAKLSAPGPAHVPDLSIPPTLVGNSAEAI